MSSVLDFSKPVVVLAPMAGITNLAYRRLCRETSSMRNPTGVPALFVSEMITSRALIERDPETLRMTTFGSEESPRSLQLYGVDPDVVSKAVAMIVAEDRADHIDLNMGCPVPKVTRKGGGAALPWKQQHFRNILKAAVDAAGALPVSVKMRMGIDEDHLTYLK
ncbi:MAG: tRNA dihydrouridine synthase, partial [Candidatus Nanopelagicales bacterium]